MPKLKDGTKVYMNLTFEGRKRLDRLQEVTGATQASVVEEAMLLMERVKSGENLFELYSEPLKYMMVAENEKAIQKLRDAIYGGLQKILNDRLHDLQKYEIASAYMIAEMFRLVTKSDKDAQGILDGFTSTASNVVKQLERERYRVREE